MSIQKCFAGEGERMVEDEYILPVLFLKQNIYWEIKLFSWGGGGGGGF